MTPSAKPAPAWPIRVLSRILASLLAAVLGAGVAIAAGVVCGFVARVVWSAILVGWRLLP